MRIERLLPLFIENRNLYHFFSSFHQHARSMNQNEEEILTQKGFENFIVIREHRRAELNSQKTAIMPPCNNLQKEVSVNRYGLCRSSITYP